MHPEPTVFIVDDDAAVRQSLLALLKSMRLPAEAFATASAFREAYRPTRPGCVLLDARLPDANGVELLEHLTAEKFHLPVIVISGHGDVATVVRAMRAGALNFLEKPCREQELWEAVREALRCDARNRRRLARRQSIQRRLARLTPGERQVLHRLLAGKSNKTIAAELNVSVRAIEVRRAKVMEKTRADSLAELIRMTLAAGKRRGERSSV
jgi:two-component system, LuxR family, response regulator FixJ